MTRPPISSSSFPDEEKKSADGEAAAVVSASTDNQCQQHTNNNSSNTRKIKKRSVSVPQHCLIASSQAETLLISSAGDILTSRCRLSPYPSGSAAVSTYQWQDDIAALCCEATDCDDLSTRMQTSSNICAPWRHPHDSNSSNSSSNRRPNGKGGLLGGAPAADVVTAFHHPTQPPPPPPPPPQTQQHDDTKMNGNGHLHSSTMQSVIQESSSSLSSRAQKAFRTLPSDTDSTIAGFDAESILPIRSFDHSLYSPPSFAISPASPRNRCNRQHQKQPRNHASEKENIPHFPHGIPTFSSHFSNVKVRTVSAHPLGSHVLLISNAGLLYSYGLNHYGQLGIGLQSDIRGAHKGYVMTPTIVTPLVENGGKAVACAAGISHSLVVVETQERRLKKSRSFEGLLHTKNNNSNNNSEVDEADTSSTDMVHHQVYGFGRNDYMKIGLVRPKAAARHRNHSGSQRPGDTARSNTKNAVVSDGMESVVVPRRVALHASFRQNSTNSSSGGGGDFQPNQKNGIFAIAAGAQHSAALVRTQSGDVEMYAWGNSTHGSLGLPSSLSSLSPQQQQPPHAPTIVSVPTFVPTLSRTPSNPETAPLSLLLDDEFPTALSLGRTCSFVVTSRGRCFTCGTSDEGILGLGLDVKETRQPTEVFLPPECRDERAVSVSAGASHVLLACASGAVFAWGVGQYAGIMTEQQAPSPPPPPEQRPSSSSSSGSGSKAKPTTTPRSQQQSEEQAKQQLFEWSPKRVVMPCEHHPYYPSRSNDGTPQPAPVVQACAGLDCSLFLSQSGAVYAAGKKSGRLGLGELPEVASIVGVPRPLFGGLHLWKRDDADSPFGHYESSVQPRLVPPPNMPARKLLTRGMTVG